MSNLTVVIPMAGSGRRFRESGYTLPKPFIEVRGQPMIARVIQNIRPPGATLILIAQRADVQTQRAAFDRLAAHYGAEIIVIDGPTEGAACTVLLAKSHIDNGRELLLANSDQLMDFSVQEFIDEAKQRRLDGSLLTFPEPARDSKWSYVRLGEDGLVEETREKVAISEHATAGVYWFAHGRLFVKAAEEMIAAGDRCNNEFYVCPAYNYLIRKGSPIGVYEIDGRRMHGLGTPEDLRLYLAQNTGV
jgi:NDP-sugar pyrophosphorylase family protein